MDNTKKDLTAKEIDIPLLNDLPNNLAKMTYDDMSSIFIDANLLPHFEEITGTFSTMDGELLRYILVAKIPLEKFIRMELTNRGCDENTYWVGFEKAKEIWLK